MTNLDSVLKKQRHYLADKVLSSQSYDFSSSHVRMGELDHKEGCVPKIDAFELWCWRRLFFFFFKLYNIVLVLPNIEMNPPQV